MQSFYIVYIQTPYHCAIQPLSKKVQSFCSPSAEFGQWPDSPLTQHSVLNFRFKQSFPGSPPCLLNITTCSLNYSIEPGVEKSHEHREMNSLWLGSSWLTFTDLLLGQLTPPLALACLRASPCVTTLGRAGPCRIQMISSSSFRFLTELHEAMLG